MEPARPRLDRNGASVVLYGRLKKSKPSAPIARPKAPARDFDAYFAGAPKSSRAALLKLRAAIRSAVPAGSTEIISYRIPAFSNQGVLVWYAAFASHCSLFPKASVIRKFRAELTGYSTSTGTVHFPNDKPLPIGLIKRLVKARVAEIGPRKKA
jgi:uncharacterized protein YdhG (YjbR/CyaY superfamily)